MIMSPSETASNSNPSKRRRDNTGDCESTKRGVSMDFSLRSEDFQLDPLGSGDILSDIALRPLSSGDIMMRLKSTDIVENMMLPDTSVTAATALKAERPSSSSEKKVPIQHEKIGKLNAKLERRSTGDDLVPLNMSFRISSGNWIKDFETESGDLMTMHPSLFLGNHPSLFKDNVHDAYQPSTSPLPFNTRLVNSRKDGNKEYEAPNRSSRLKPTPVCSLKSAKISSSEWVEDFQGEPVDSGPMYPSLFVAAAEQPVTFHLPMDCHSASYNAYQTHLASSKTMSTTSEPPCEKTITLDGSHTDHHSAYGTTCGASCPPTATTTTKKKKKKKSRKRVLDETQAVEPSADDVLSGRGGFTNTHPGNIRFRQKALEFRPWYEESSKEKKQEIADLLVNFVLDTGHRFLGKGKDGLWYEMVGKGPHYKASQALRERIKDGIGK